MNNNPKDYFDNQVTKFSGLISELKTRIRRVSIARLLTFLITVIGIYIAVANNYALIALLITAGFGVFIYLIRLHLKLEKSKNLNEAMLEINTTELFLLEGKTNRLDTGEEYLNVEHPYNEDLDIFGQKSLFQLINRSATTKGKKALGYRLNNVITDINILNLRQDAISELAKKPEWRQSFQANGKLFKENESDLENLIKWSKTSETNFNRLFYKAMLIINPLIGFGIIALAELSIINYSYLLFFLLIPFSLIGSKFGILNKMHATVSKKTGLLQKYAELFSIITNESFESKLLNEIKQQIGGTNSAHIAIKKLAKITKSMDYRLNMLVGFFLNIFFLWDIKQVIKIEKWKENNSTYLDEWFEQLSTMDELQSFAGFAFSWPNSIFPKFCDDNFTIEATNVKHPFISRNSNIGNPIKIDGWKQFHIITGANMAGKSTYLRTTGVNLILAMTGSVVLADSFLLKPTKLFTGIKTTDSLQDGESYFFAELKRLKSLIDILESGQQLFILLDEVLRGTNSADKQRGSMALISQLINLNSSGMIATHDLALGTLINKFPSNIKNKRFEVEISNNDLVFDYKLKEGISQNLNATFLMKKMGITL